MGSHFEGRGAPGHVLAGKYELVREIGRGGMGLVWRAERLDWDREPVAVKLMLSRLESPDARARFAREAKTAVKLRSPHVVQVLDHGIDEATGTPYLVMELLEEGECLRSRLERLRILAPREVMRLVNHLGRALTRARRFHVVHRDLKPENIFLIENPLGEVARNDEHFAKVLDFGLAKMFDSSTTINSRTLTAPGNAVGTPAYMSPEQLRGAVPDHRGDLWSLAVIVFECLLGRRPFDGSDVPEIAVQIFTDPRPVPSQVGEVPKGFDAWFATATHPNIEQRFQDVETLVKALQSVCGTSAGTIPPLMYQRDALARTSSAPRKGASTPEAPIPSLSPVTGQPGARASSMRYAKGFRAGLVGLALGLGTFSVYAYRQSIGRGSEALSVVSQAAPLTPTPSEPQPPVPQPPAAQQQPEVADVIPARPVPPPAQSEAAETLDDAARRPPAETATPSPASAERANVPRPARSRSPAGRHKPPRAVRGPGATQPAPAEADDLIDREY